MVQQFILSLIHVVLGVDCTYNENPDLYFLCIIVYCFKSVSNSANLY